MADAYVDQGAYASNIGAAPTWGTPQEGDGSATTAAAASSIASIAFGSVPTSGTFSCCGLSISTTGVIGAGSADAAANALATNINAVSSTVASGVAYGTPQLRNLVYARGPSGGAAAGTCEIMMRVGSTTLNYATNSNAAIASTFDGSPTVVQFVGGTGGCWGWFLADVALGVSSSIAIRTYGLKLAKPMVVYTGWTFGQHDDIIVRTGRNITISLPSGCAGQAGKPTYTNFIFDNGTTWTGDSSTGQLTLAVTLWQGGAQTVGSWAYASCYSSYTARTLGGLTVNLTASNTNGAGSVFLFYDTAATTYGAHFKKVKFVEQVGSSATNYWYMQMPTSGATRSQLSFVDCLLDFSAVQRTNIGASLIDVAAPHTCQLIGNTIKYALTGVGGAALTVPLIKQRVTGAFGVQCRGNTIDIGQPQDLPIFSANSVTFSAGAVMVFENNKGAGITTGAVGLFSSANVADNSTLVFDNLAIGGAVKVENRRGYYEWNPGQPTLSATAPDGTPWAWLVYWTNAASAITLGTPGPSPITRVQSRLADGARSWTLELLCDAVSVTNLPTLAVVEVQYVTPAGAVVAESVPITLSASPATWANVGVAPYNTWTAKKISGTTGSDVALDSLMQFRLRLDRPVAGGSTAAFVLDPEPSLT